LSSTWSEDQVLPLSQNACNKKIEKLKKTFTTRQGESKEGSSILAKKTRATYT
jgi:hypothetical protein